jgi:putative hemolysin
VSGFWGEVLIVLALIAVNAVMAMSEVAVVSARKARLQQRAERGDAGAAAALQLADEPTRFLSTVQVGITLVGIFAGAFGGATLANEIALVLADVPALAPYAHAIALAGVVATITYLSLILGELVPKRIGLANAEALAGQVARPMRLLSTIAGPVVTFLSVSTEVVLRVLRVPTDIDRSVTEEDVRVMLAEGTRSGVFLESEREIVESVFKFGDRRVDELMVPRSQVAWLDAEDPPEVNWRTIAETGHGLYPVARGDLDALLGVASTRRLAAEILGGRMPDLTESLLEPTFVPETMTALQLLELFRGVTSRVVMVVDEHGMIVGLVTPTDILESIVGDLPGMESDQEPSIVSREDGSWLVDGLVTAEELMEVTGAEPGRGHGQYRTVGGLVMHQLGHLPRAGDRLTWAGLKIEVMDMDGRRVDKVLVTPAEPEPPTTESAAQ